MYFLYITYTSANNEDGIIISGTQVYAWAIDQS